LRASCTASAGQLVGWPPQLWGVGVSAIPAAFPSPPLLNSFPACPFIPGRQVSTLSHLRFLSVGGDVGSVNYDMHWDEAEEIEIGRLPQLRSLLLSNICLPPTAACLTNLQLLSVCCKTEYALHSLPEVLPNLTQLTCLVSGLGWVLGMCSSGAMSQGATWAAAVCSTDACSLCCLPASLPTCLPPGTCPVHDASSSLSHTHTLPCTIPFLACLPTHLPMPPCPPSNLPVAVT